MRSFALRKVTVLLALLLTASSVFVTSPASAQGAVRDFGSESGFLGSINAQRAAGGLAPLTLQGSMSAAANNWALQMTNGSFLAHAGDIVSGTPGGWTKVGENVGRGQTVASLTSAFMSSAGHRANIMDVSYTHIGIAVYLHPSDGRMYTTHRFAALPGAAPVAVAPVVPTAVPTLPPVPTPIPPPPPPTPIPTLAPVPTLPPAPIPTPIPPTPVPPTPAPPTPVPAVATAPAATSPLPTLPPAPTATTVPPTATAIPATAIPVPPTATAIPATATPAPPTPAPPTPAVEDVDESFGAPPERLAFVDPNADANPVAIAELELAKAGSKGKKLELAALRNINYRSNG